MEATETTQTTPSTHDRMPDPALAAARPPDPDAALPLRWLVPVDEHADHAAALEFAKWLDAAGGEAPPASHVHIDGLYVPTSGGMPVGAIAREARNIACERGAGDIVADFVKADAETLPSEMLHEVDRTRYDGVVLARRAEAESPGLVRLGGYARRVLLQANCAVCIVPSDLRGEDVPEGPVVLAVDPANTSNETAQLASRLASTKSRRLVLVHVIPTELTSSMSSEVSKITETRAEAEREAMDRLRAWSLAHEVPHAWRRVVHGEVRFGIEHSARHLGASVVVCGTRQRSLLGRMFEPSNALDIGRFSTRPVVVVPT